MSTVSGSANSDLTKSSQDKPPSTNLISNRTVWARLSKGSQARARFVESHLSKNLAFQIRMLREQAGWSQGQLAARLGMNQNAISRLENPSYGKATLSTLKRVASAFDVAVTVRFEPFSKLVNWVTGTPYEETGLSVESLSVRNFESERHASLGSISDVQQPGRVIDFDLGSIQESRAAGGAASEAAA